MQVARLPRALADGSFSEIGLRPNGVLRSRTAQSSLRSILDISSSSQARSVVVLTFPREPTLLRTLVTGVRGRVIPRRWHSPGPTRSGAQRSAIACEGIIDGLVLTSGEAQDPINLGPSVAPLDCLSRSKVGKTSYTGKE